MEVVTTDIWGLIKDLIENNTTYTVNKEDHVWYDRKKKGTQIILKEVSNDMEYLDDTFLHIRNKHRFMLIIYAENRTDRDTAYRELKTLFTDRTKTSLYSDNVELVLFNTKMTDAVADQEIHIQGEYYHKVLELIAFYREDFTP